MLLRFNVKNFLSFNETTEFSMFPGNVRTKENHLINTKKSSILRFGALYGANAAGKSNLVKAMGFSRKVILNGIESISGGKYFRLKEGNKNETTSFEYEFYIDGNYYAYGFNTILEENRITGEWLYDISYKEEKLIFERDIENKTFNHNTKFENKKDELRFYIYSEDYKFNDKVLLLRELNRNKEDIYVENSDFSVFRQVYNWFSNYLDINYADEPITNFQYLLGSDSCFNSKISDILNMFGTGITDFKLIDTTPQEIKNEIPKDVLEDIISKLKNRKGTINLRTGRAFHNIRLDEKHDMQIKTIAFKHGESNCDFYLSDESDGTRRLMDLIEILINTENKVFIVDEIDRSLHPNLTYKFIELFLNLSSNKNTQLIITTHEDRVLDLDLLRRDEIWFAEKENDGSTKLYSLENYKPRFDKKTCRAYLEGRYGAVPIFKNPDLSIFDEDCN